MAILRHQLSKKTGTSCIDEEIDVHRRRTASMTGSRQQIASFRQPYAQQDFLCQNIVKLFVSRLVGIKYLFKYDSKGRERVTIQIQNEKARQEKIKRFAEYR